MEMKVYSVGGEVFISFVFCFRFRFVFGSPDGYRLATSRSRSVVVGSRTCGQAILGINYVIVLVVSSSYHAIHVLGKKISMTQE